MKIYYRSLLLHNGNQDVSARFTVEFLTPFLVIKFVSTTHAVLYPAQLGINQNQLKLMKTQLLTIVQYPKHVTLFSGGDFNSRVL